MVEYNPSVVGPHDNIRDLKRTQDILVNSKCVVIVNYKQNSGGVVSVQHITLMWRCCLHILDMVEVLHGLH